MIVWGGVVAALLAMGISALAVPLSRRVAQRLNYLDFPQRHKTHAKPTTLLGGSAIFIAILAPSLLAMSLVSYWGYTYRTPAFVPEALRVHIAGAWHKAPQALAILAAAFVLHVLGLIDDRRNLGPWIKLFVQMAMATMVVVFFDVRVLRQPAAGPALGIIASIVWLTAITNAFNFLDNMDGLCAGVASICAAALLAAAASMGQVFVSAWLCLILGALLGYLPYNFPPASTFMGDAGSLVVGFLLGVVCCLTTYVGPPGSSLSAGAIHYSILAPLVLMAVPLYDMISVLILRVRQRQNPMVGDRKHFSHRLVRRGMSVRAAVLTVYLCTAGTAIAATLLPHVVDGIGAMLVFSQTVAILLIIALLESSDSKS